MKLLKVKTLKKKNNGTSETYCLELIENENQGCFDIWETSFSSRKIKKDKFLFSEETLVFVEEEFDRIINYKKKQGYIEYNESSHLEEYRDPLNVFVFDEISKIDFVTLLKQYLKNHEKRAKVEISYVYKGEPAIKVNLNRVISDIMKEPNYNFIVKQNPHEESEWTVSIPLQDKYHIEGLSFLFIYSKELNVISSQEFCWL